MSSYIKECLGLSSQNTQTFRVSHKKAEVFTIGSTQEPNEKIVQLLERQKRPCTEILESTKFPLKIVAQSNGFVNTLLEAYNQHHNLVIRPDDVWGAIIIQFSFYVTKHLEEFREKFIEFPGKKRLEIDITGNATTTPYQAFIKAVTKEVDLNLEDVGLKDWVLPNFSTTTENDVVTTGVVLMAAMKQYFTHGCNMLCGIPSVTLEGTLEDWEEIYTRLGRLKEFELERWYGMLEPVLKQFVNSKMGKVDKAFWQRICHYEKFGSGETHLSGWITAFCVFDWEGNWQGEEQSEADDRLHRRSSVVRIDTRLIPTGIVEVDVAISDNGSTREGVLYAGHMAMEVKEEGTTLQPTLGWVMAVDPKEKA